MQKVYTFSNIHSLKNRIIFFDANILIFLFWPTITKNNRSEKYSKIFKILLQQKVNPTIDFIVISEVINRAIRTEYAKHLQEKNLSKKELRFKTYRDSQEGQMALSDIYITLRKIIREMFNIVGKEFSQINIESFLKVDDLDFSDKGILVICRDNDFVLFTDDKDYTNSKVEILTLNKDIMKRRHNVS